MNLNLFFLEANPLIETKILIERRKKSMIDSISQIEKLRDGIE